MAYVQNLYAFSDTAIVAQIAEYIKQRRLDKNKTQQELADEAGINRTTLAQLEKGGNFSMLTFIQVLRALGELYHLSELKYEPQISPLKLAEMEMSKRYRATKSKKGSTTDKPKSDW